MQATSFLAFMTMLRYFIPLRLAEMQEHDTLMFCQRQDIGTSGHQNTHTIVSGERVKLYNQCFSYICVTNYPQTWWIETSTFIVSQFLWIRDQGVAWLGPLNQGLLKLG